MDVPSQCFGRQNIVIYALEAKSLLHQQFCPCPFRFVTAIAGGQLKQFIRRNAFFQAHGSVLIAGLLYLFACARNASA